MASAMWRRSRTLVSWTGVRPRGMQQPPSLNTRFLPPQIMTSKRLANANGQLSLVLKMIILGAPGQMMGSVVTEKGVRGAGIQTQLDTCALYIA